MPFPSPSSITLREASDRDGDQLAELIRTCFDEYPGCIFDREREFPELDAIASHFERANGRLWVALEDEVVIGSLGVRPTASGRHVELLKVYVARAWRGRGLAVALLDQALRFARERGALALELWSDTRFHRAHGFYVKHGFTATAETRVLDDLSATSELRFVRGL